MDNFKFQVQSLKSQIDYIKLQLSNIENQCSGPIFCNPSEQLINVSIQILNTGIQAFNTGKNEGIVSDNYYEQIKNISSLINTILKEYQSRNMQQQMMQQQMMQQQMMQQQMMQQQQMMKQQQMMQQQIIQQQQMEQQIMLQQIGENMNKEKLKKLNVIIQHPLGLKFNLAPYIGTKIKDLLDKFSVKMGAPKNNFIFVYNGEKLKHDDPRKIEEILQDFAKIVVLDNKK